MKKFILTLTLALISLFSFSQTYYVASLTEMYTYNSKTEGWDLYQKNNDVSINVVLEEEFVSFQAKTPTFFRIYKNTGEDISTKSFSGMRYKGYDLKRDNSVYIDICKFSESSYLISIIKAGDYNLRYFIVL